MTQMPPLVVSVSLTTASLAPQVAHASGFAAPGAQADALSMALNDNVVTERFVKFIGKFYAETEGFRMIFC